ncbi:C2H2 type zinc-finger-domain-containing protein [Xylaria bambusicola]|uniref:C2H2 type zinc-finger-domain-containing protein n=1 Tax=Xylaria bambusicola TaxID=326684 RepID=UPI002008001B|nr:C2H2 type zinc-finger-domain-containing protein [Xylaria bambusicola]KAI0514914.1 C2H2 type zinc-finger-domain-containing protein [Xylaria bambusicola]
MATIASNRPASTAFPAQQDVAPSSHQYTCNTCQVAFRYADTQKGHMKSDWHRYNLKRRVASLPPISSEVFTEKVIQARAATAAEADRAGFQQLCEVCQRTYYSENSYRNHISSQKHKAKEAALAKRGATIDDASSVMSSTFSLGNPISVPSEGVDSDAEVEFSEVVEGLQKTSLKERPSPVKRPSNPAPSDSEGQEEHAASELPNDTTSRTETPVPATTLKSCLFCNYDSPTIPLNVVHMERIHGMFIPEKQYLVDLDGLITSLQQRIREYHECLYCGKMKNTVPAVQTHMRDKGHCMIPFTTEEEQLMIGEFYDFRSTYSDEEDSEDESVDDDKPNGGAKLGAKRPSKAVGENGDEIIEEEEGWETDSSASSCDSEDLQSIPVDNSYRQFERLDKHPHHSSHDPRHHHQKDGWHSHAHKHRAIFYDDAELHLPSGRAVGHRSLAKYYRQNLHHYPTPEERAEKLAIEAAKSSDIEESTNGNRQVSRRQDHGKFGAVVTRANGGRGMTGVSEQKKKEVQRAVPRSVRQQQMRENRNTWLLNRRNNHQEHYNYQIL